MSHIKGFFLARADVSAESVCVSCLQLNFVRVHTLHRRAASAATELSRRYGRISWPDVNRENLDAFLADFRPQFREAVESRAENLGLSLLDFLQRAQPNRSAVQTAGYCIESEGTRVRSEVFVVEVTAEAAEGRVLDVFVPREAMVRFVRRAQIALEETQPGELQPSPTETRTQCAADTAG